MQLRVSAFHLYFCFFLLLLHLVLLPITPIQNLAYCHATKIKAGLDQVNIKLPSRFGSPGYSSSSVVKPLIILLFTFLVLHLSFFFILGSAIYYCQILRTLNVLVSEGVTYRLNITLVVSSSQHHRFILFPCTFNFNCHLLVLTTTCFHISHYFSIKREASEKSLITDNLYS